MTILEFKSRASASRSSTAHEGKMMQLRPQRNRAIAVTGGKGGVGKSSIAVNLAVAYAQSGARSLAVDADLGMADLNLLLGVAPEKSLLDVLMGCPVEEALVESHGIHLLPALNGSYGLETLDAAARARVFSAVESLGESFDTLVVDVAAGIGANQTEFAGAAADVLLVVTPEALSLADAYASLKVLSRRQNLGRAYVVPNCVRTAHEAEETYARLSSLVRRFLDIELVALPPIPRDRNFSEAAAVGVPLMVSHPDSPAARAIRQLARRLDAIASPDARENVAQMYWRGLLGETSHSTMG